MQTNRKAVRFYIDRDGATPVVRSVPVSRPSVANVAADQTTPATFGPAGERATAFAASESQRRGTRQRLASLVQKPRRKLRAEAS